MGKGGSQAQSLGGGGRNETGDYRHAIGIERIQGPTEGIIIELGGGNAGRHEAGGRLMLEEPRDEGERVVDTSQTIEPHCFDAFPDGEVPHCWVLLRGFVHDFATAKFVKHARDKAKMS
jgi:hypothetical protein